LENQAAEPKESRSFLFENPMYKDFFGFSEDPFSLTPDPAFLYMTLSHWEALSTMMDGIKERKGIIVITGDVGTGKTTLINALLKDLSDQIKTAFIFNPQLTFKQLLKAILRELNVLVRGENTYTLLYKFDEYLREKSAANETVVILIDEAQAMRPAVLRDFDRLLQRDAAQAKVLQTLLVGQLELEAHLDSEELLQFKHRIAIHRRIRPLTEEETRGYIDHRLKKVGSESSKIFTPEALDLIGESAQGIPRVINLVCDGALFAAYSESNQKIDAKLVQEVLVENEIIAGEEEGGALEVPGEQGAVGKKEAAAEEEALAGLEGFAAGALPGRGKDLAEKEVTLEGKAVAEMEIVAETELLGEKEVIALKEAIEEMPSLRPREEGEVPRDRLLHKKIWISVSVFAVLAALVLVYWPQVRMLFLKDGEQIFSSPQEGAGKREPESIKKKEAREGTYIKAEGGWNLFSLAKRNYGATNPTLIDLLLEANPQITDMNLIQLNQSIMIPRITEELLLTQESHQAYKIHLGTFGNESEVRIFRDEPLLGGKKLGIVPRKVSSRETWYRIYAGEFKTKEEAQRTIQALKQKGLLPAFPGGKKKS
jgi:general secretion pathway protein A